jgi:hypothetical protein
MGFWKNLRAGAAFMRDYQQDAMQTLPRWARVVRVGRRPFGMVSVDVEIHYGRTPPHVESVPRGVQLQVGRTCSSWGRIRAATATTRHGSSTRGGHRSTGAGQRRPSSSGTRRLGRPRPRPHRRVSVSGGCRSCGYTCSRGRSRRRSTNSTCERSGSTRIRVCYRTFRSCSGS